MPQKRASVKIRKQKIQIDDRTWLCDENESDF